MTLKELKNEVNGLLTTVAPNTKFYVAAHYWSDDNCILIDLAIYPNESQEKEAAERIRELYYEIAPRRCNAPQKFIAGLKKNHRHLQKGSQNQL